MRRHLPHQARADVVHDAGAFLPVCISGPMPTSFVGQVSRSF